MADSKCRECKAEVVWAQCKDKRIALDPAVPVYRLLFGGGTPTVEKCSSTPGMPHVALAEHARVCRGKAKKDEDE